MFTNLEFFLEVEGHLVVIIFMSLDAYPDPTLVFLPSFFCTSTHQFPLFPRNIASANTNLSGRRHFDPAIVPTFSCHSLAREHFPGLIGTLAGNNRAFCLNISARDLLTIAYVCCLQSVLGPDYGAIASRPLLVWWKGG